MYKDQPRRGRKDPTQERIQGSRPEERIQGSRPGEDTGILPRSGYRDSTQESIRDPTQDRIQGSHPVEDTGIPSRR